MEVLLPLLFLVLLLPLFLTMRRQKREAEQKQTLMDSLELGDRVMTTSGLYAVVVDLDDEETIELEISEGFVTTWLRDAVAKKIDETDEAEEDTEEAEESDETDEVGERAR